MLQGVGTLLRLSIVSGSSNIGPMLGEGGLGFGMLRLPGEGRLGKNAAAAAAGTWCSTSLEAQLLLPWAAANNAASTSIPAALSVANMLSFISYFWRSGSIAEDHFFFFHKPSCSLPKVSFQPLELETPRTRSVYSGVSMAVERMSCSLTPHS